MAAGGAFLLITLKNIYITNKTMTEILIYVAIGLVALIVGIIGTIAIQKSVAKSRAKIIIEEANREAETIKKNKIGKQY